MNCAVLYARMSLDKTGEGLGIERQLDECRRVATSRGFEVVEVVTENNVSATFGKRDGYTRVLDILKSGKADVVVVWKVDRLLRRIVDLEELIDVCEKHNAQVVTATGDIDLSSSAGRLIGRILASVARSEMETKSERHRLANSQRAKAGLPHKGRRAFGYSADGMTLVEDEAVALKELGARFLSGYTYTQLADWLNESGYTTAMGNQFYNVAIRQMLQRDRYRGVRVYNGTEYAAAWPAVWDEDTWQRIQYTIKQRTEASGNRPAYRRHLLTGLLTCGACGATMNGTTTYDNRTREPRKTYRCNRNRGGCGKVSRSAFALEWWIRELICYRLDSPELAILMQANDPMQQRSSKLLARQASSSARLESLLDDYADGTLTKTEYKRAKERATTALEAVGRELEALHVDRSLTGLVGAGESVKRRWEIEGDGWRRGLVELLIADITIQPSVKKPRIYIDGRLSYFDSASVLLNWKF